MATDQNISECQLTNGVKLSHKKLKALRKKEKRKAARQAEAKRIHAQNVDQSPSSESCDEEREKELERQLEEEHRKWLAREEKAQTEWKLLKEREEKEKQRIEEQKREIQKEWEERQKIEKEEQEEREKKEKEKKEKQEALLKEATANENKDDGVWHNPIAPANYGKEQLRETCSFFKKTGACRFGDRCSRGHPDPEVETTILFPGMYSHFELEQTLRDEYDTDIGLEYEEGETYQHFKDFYDDVLPEFQKFGRVVQFKVCCNYEPHLRGNVYVQFQREEEAHHAYTAFNGRFYGGKQLSGQFVVIEKWKMAICGLYGRQRCPKGKNCNFLHVFHNPRNEFRDADFDNGPFSQRERSMSYRHTDDRRKNGYDRNQSGRRSRSRERSSRSRSYRRSRSRSRSRMGSVRSHKRSPSRSRRKSRSPSRKRSRSRESRSRRSPSQKHRRQRSRSRSRYKSKKRSRTRSRSPGDNASSHRRETDQRLPSKSRNSAREEEKNGLDKREITPPVSYENSSVNVLNTTNLDNSVDGSNISDSERSVSHRHKTKKHKKDKRSRHSPPKTADLSSIITTDTPPDLNMVDEIIQQSLTH